MRKKLTMQEYVFLTSMLFGLFFGAGNLIFPAFMGQLSGEHMGSAITGFLITGVGLPLLGIVAMGISHSEGLYDMGCRVSRKYSIFFTVALYLTIGPFFAIPRTATVSFSVGIANLPFVTENNSSWMLLLFSALFFLVVLFFSLRPTQILTWVGKVLNPIFLLFLGVLAVTALLRPMGSIHASSATGAYVHQSFFTGFLEGYNTMDALASLAFGIVIIDAIRGLGVESEDNIAATTVKAGIFSMSLMGIIYVALTVIGAQSRAVYPICKDGGEVLYTIASHYFGGVGAVILAATITVACLKTAIGLVTSCANTFVQLFPDSVGYKVYAVIFSVISFGLANFGLSRIIAYSIPVLMFLYPLTIVLILLSLFGRFYGYDRRVYICTITGTMIASVLDFAGALPEGVQRISVVSHLVGFARVYVPLYSIGMDWILPAGIGFCIGLTLYKIKSKVE